MYGVSARACVGVYFIKFAKNVCDVLLNLQRMSFLKIILLRILFSILYFFLSILLNKLLFEKNILYNFNFLLLKNNMNENFSVPKLTFFRFKTEIFVNYIFLLLFNFVILTFL